MIRRALLRLARTRLGGWLARAALHRFPGLLPLRRIPAPPGWVVFHHPAPSYPVHALLIPVPPLPGLDRISDREAGKLAGVFSMADDIARRLRMAPGRQLVLNGGSFQDVRVLHFHLVSEQ